MAGFGAGDTWPIGGPTAGVALSWDSAGRSVDVDLQAVAFDHSGKLLDAVYYNNLKAIGKGLTHSSDEITGAKSGYDEVIWANLSRLPEHVRLILFVVACYKGGHICDVPNGKLSLLDHQRSEVAAFPLENSSEEVDLVAAFVREPAEEGPSAWSFQLVHEPAQDGQHFIDILEPTIGNFVRKVIPGAPRRIKACFAMEKGSLVDLPKSSAVKSVQAGLGWDTSSGEVDLDVSALQLDQNGAEVSACFFGDLVVPGFKHSGDNLTGEGSGDDEVIEISLEEIPAVVQQVFLIINIYDMGANFSQVANPYCRLVSSDGEVCRYQLRDTGQESGLAMARMIREPGGRWGFQALGVPMRGRQYKDSLPYAQAIFHQSPHALQLVHSSSSLGAAEHPTGGAGGGWGNATPAAFTNAGVVQATPVAAEPVVVQATPVAAMPGSVEAAAQRRFCVTITSASGLRSADWNGYSDPFVVCSVPGRTSRAQTQVKSKTLNPRWDESFDLSGMLCGNEALMLEVFDYDMFGPPDFLGMASLSLQEVFQCGECSVELPLRNDGHPGVPVTGSISVAVKVHS